MSPAAQSSCGNNGTFEQHPRQALREEAPLPGPLMVELAGLEPATSWLRSRSTNQCYKLTIRVEHEGAVVARVVDGPLARRMPVQAR